MDTKKVGQHNYQSQECIRGYQGKTNIANAIVGAHLPDKDSAAVIDAGLSAVFPLLLKIPLILPSVEDVAEIRDDNELTDMLLEMEEGKYDMDDRRGDNEYISKHFQINNQVNQKHILEKSVEIEKQQQQKPYQIENNDITKPKSYLKYSIRNEKFELNQCFTSGTLIKFAKIEHPTLNKIEQLISMPVYLEKQQEDDQYIIRTTNDESISKGAVISKSFRRRRNRKSKDIDQENSYKYLTDYYNTTKMNCKTNQTKCITSSLRRNNNPSLMNEKLCDKCGSMFPNEEILKNHQQIEFLNCMKCGIKFSNNELLRKQNYIGHKIYKQKLTVVKKKKVHIHQCQCGKVFASRILLGQHLQVHYIGTKKGACHYCLLEFEDKFQILQHLLDAHGAQLFICQQCDRAFFYESIRNRHEKMHKAFLCIICNNKYKTYRALALHIEKFHRSIACRMCGKMIDNIISLRRHEKKHICDKGLHCDLCHNTFINKTAFLVHTNVHAGQIVHPCKTCSLGFVKQQALEEHQLLHIKNEYNCRKCNLVCHSSAYFWMHLKLHGSTFICNICNRTFRDTSLLAIHRRNRHYNVRPYQCPHCPKAFSIGKILRIHMYIHTKAFPHVCLVCKQGFLTTYGFHKHLDLVHTRVKQVDNQ